MSEHEQQQAELLETYWTALAQDATATPPEELDAELTATVQRLERRLHPPEPGDTFAVQLQHQLEAQTAAPVRRRNVPSTTLAHRWSLAGLAIAVVLVIALVSFYLWMGRPQPVSAQEIVQRAQASVRSPTDAGVQSFVLTQTQRAVPTSRLKAESGLKGDEVILSETRRWYQAPNRWRNEFQQAIVTPDSKEVSHSTFVLVSDGTDVWQYHSDGNNVIVNRLEPDMNGKDQISLFGRDIGDLNALFQQASTCFDPKVTGSAIMAGRAAYVIDLGPTKCPSASAAEMNGRQVIWVDKETFFVLKQELHSMDGDQIIMTNEVTQIQYNVPIDPVQFTFTPPAGSTIADNRPKPAPTTDQFQQQLAQLAKQVEFPIFVPTYLPPGLAPRQPKIDPVMDSLVAISYFPIDEPDKDSTASRMKGLTIQEQRATNSLVAQWTDSADPMAIAGNKGWLRRGVRNADGTGSDSAALVLRDGVLISVSSFTIAPEELVKVAASLQPVPGSHAPLPNPTPPTLAELRQRVAFPIFVPAFVPAGLTPERPISGESPNETVRINYHNADGAIVLTLLNGPIGCCLDADPRKGGTAIKLFNGTSAHFMHIEPQYGGPILWWQKDGAYVAISGPNMTQDELAKIAASMSKTADLGKVEEPPARPTPTPLPPLQYKILRPAWLPEPMTVREQRDGDVFTLGFDPRPNDAPHSVLMLTEMPKDMISRGGSPDPQASQETIGGYDVTIVRRGQNCITLEWQVGELALTLTNPYDPPGHPRYSCDQLRKIVESIR